MLLAPDNRQEKYLFAEMQSRVKAYRETHPKAEILSLGIGDVSGPLPKVAARAMAQAAEEQGRAEKFRGYGPEQGYPFLRRAIAEYYAKRDVTLSADEIFISSGAKENLVSLCRLFDPSAKVLLTDPTYPAYLQVHLQAGRPVSYLPATRENGFLPLPPRDTEGEIIHLCSPANPTGAVYTKEGLQHFLDFANRRQSVILFDAAYEAFIRDPALPHSILELPEAKTCAIEIGSFSKFAGFTGIRCGWCIIPKELVRQGVTLRARYLKDLASETNGVCYPAQVGAAAVLTAEGLSESKESLRAYHKNADLLADFLRSRHLPFAGGENAPYLFAACPKGITGFALFDRLLQEAAVVVTPGEGFGPHGEGFFRLSAFGREKDIAAAIRRLSALPWFGA